MNRPDLPSGSEPPARPSPASMRASDTDRDQVADRLREALAEGRITPQEHAERIDVVYDAKTYAELEPVLSDLPSAEAPRPRVDLRKPERQVTPPSPQSPNLVAIFSGVARTGRWLVEPTINVACVFGGVELDFRQAVLSRSEVTVNVTGVFGGVNMTVPPGVRVVGSNIAIFGGNDLPEDDTTDPDAPVIRLTGLLLFSGISVKRRAVGEKTGRHDRHRDLHRLHRDHLEELREHALDRREERMRQRDERRERRDERHRGR